MNEKHIAFIEKYLQCFNATRAYLEVYPNSTYDSARKSSSELLAKPDIQEVLKARYSELVMTDDEYYALLTERARDTSNPSLQLKALELIGRTRGKFIDRQDITSAGQSISLADYLNGINQAKKKNPGITTLE